MSGGTPKPFACTSEGCTMTFTNEDHLNVHQRKHEMVLNLGLKNSSIVADQTPTPTRFLRNCEEVGLFQDLQNVNPFEETFKKAVEMVKTGSLPVPDLPEDDTLHTPHIFPIQEENMYSQIKSDKLELNLTVETGKELIVHDKNVSVLSLNSNNSPDIFNINKNPTILINDKSSSIFNDNKVKSKLVIREKKFTKLVQKPIRPIISAREKLQQILQSKQMKEKSTHPSVIIFPVLPPQINQKINAVPILQTSPLPTTQKSNIKSKNGVSTTKRNVKKDDVETKRKLEMLERNRAAATRSRAKKKEWIDTLESKYSSVCVENEKLQKENTALRNEVQQLKALLLAHKECPVTKAMNMGHIIPVGPPIISIQVPGNKNNLNSKKELKTIKPNIQKPSVIVLNETLLS